MAETMKCRGFITFLAGAMSWPAVALAQAVTPVIPQEASPDPAFARAIAAVNGKLKDPQLARYGDMIRKFGPNLNGKPAEVVCGSVASKDSAGRYGGSRPFVYFVVDEATFLVNTNPQPEDVAQIVYGRFCK